MKKSILLLSAACGVFCCSSVFGMNVLRSKGPLSSFNKINTKSLAKFPFVDLKKKDNVKYNYSLNAVGGANKNVAVLNNSQEQAGKHIKRNLLSEFNEIGENRAYGDISRWKSTFLNKDIQCVSQQMRGSNNKYRNVACFIRAGVIVSQPRKSECITASRNNSSSFSKCQSSGMTTRETNSSSKNNKKCFREEKVKFLNLYENNKKTAHNQNCNISNNVVSNEIVKKNSVFRGSLSCLLRKKRQNKAVKFFDAGKNVTANGLPAFFLNRKIKESLLSNCCGNANQEGSRSSSRQSTTTGDSSFMSKLKAVCRSDLWRAFLKKESCFCCDNTGKNLMGKFDGVSGGRRSNLVLSEKSSSTKPNYKTYGQKDIVENLKNNFKKVREGVQSRKSVQVSQGGWYGDLRKSVFWKDLYGVTPEKGGCLATKFEERFIQEKRKR